jgi:hypothetical protein
MDGNAAIPKLMLRDRSSEFSNNITELQIIKEQQFGSLSFILTGGFQIIGLPVSIIRLLYNIENLLPNFILSLISFRAIFVIQKNYSSQNQPS